MALPLPPVTFYRMADVSVTGALISDLLDAFFTAASAATDYRGTALPASHSWAWTRRRPTIVTEEVDASAPAGTPMTKTPKLNWGGRIANAGTFASPDTSVASQLQCGINKNSGVYVDWTAALPFTSGNWFGYWRAAPVALNAIGTIVRVFISQETVFVQFIQAATTQYWTYSGALIEPLDNDTTNSAESDNRLYGMCVQGSGGAVNTAWLNAQSGAMYIHGTGAGNPHGGVFQPGAGALWNFSRLESFTAVADPAQLQTPSGVYAGDLFTVCRDTGSGALGNRLGTLRGIYPCGNVQSGRYVRNGATDLIHFVSTNTGGADDGFFLPAAA